MDTLEQRKEFLLKALSTLQKAVQHKKRAQASQNFCSDIFASREDLDVVLRNSMIQCFAYCVDIFLKFLKNYLEDQGVLLETKTPKNIIRTAAFMRVMRDAEAQLAISMLASYNMIPLIYKEEIAEGLSNKIEDYCSFMVTFLERIKL